jgi:hypothetical protein
VLSVGAPMRRLAVLVVTALTACATGVDTLEEGDDPVEDDVVAEDDPADVLTEPLAAAAPGQLRVVQMNPYYAGRLAPYTMHENSCASTTECSVSGRAACTTSTQTGCYECIDHSCRQRSWETMTMAAGLFDAINADVIGIEELNPVFASKIDSILQTETGHPWEYRVTTQGVDGKGSGVAVYWRGDRVELVQDLGYVDVGTLPSRYIVRFRGVLLRIKGATNTFGFFSGKLVWGSAGDDEDRRAEAVKLRAWIDTKMAPYPGAARIVASDFNDTIGSDAYDVFGSYDDGDAVKPTSNAASPRDRIDYLFWADGKNGASKNGFVTARSDGRLGRSMYYGSDHRFVYGDALIP